MTRGPPKQCAVTGYWGLEMTRKPAYGSATEDFAYHVSITIRAAQSTIDPYRLVFCTQRSTWKFRQGTGSRRGYA